MSKKRLVSIVMALALLVGSFGISSTKVSAATWRTGRFDTGYVAKGYTTVRLSNTKKNGYIRIYTYDQTGRKSSGKIHVTLRTTSGKWICEFDTTSGTKLKLGKDHSAYRVYVAKRKYSNSIKGQGDDFINCGKCVYWGIQSVSNCYI